MTLVGIIDYGLGNLRSVAGAVAKLQHEPLISSVPAELARADRLILPGVGAFGDGMANLKARGLVDAITRMAIREQRPFLGICLGFQLLARESEEFGRHEGLGWIDGVVKRLNPPDPTLRVPHVGWNELKQRKADPLFTGIPVDALFYYVHSYCLHANDNDAVIGECSYGTPFAAVVAKGNLRGTQFHPEKSQLHGLNLLRNFLEAA